MSGNMHSMTTRSNTGWVMDSLACVHNALQIILLL
jgi:hypothetical protein